MKMAEAIAPQVRAFRLVIATDLASLVRPRVDLWAWYGIARPFPLRRLPLWLRRRDPFFDGGPAMPRRFPGAAVAYARLARPALVWTRAHVIAAGCLEAGLEVLFESHAGAEQPRLVETVRGFAKHPLLRGLVTISDALREHYASLGVPEERTFVRPAGVDLGRFAGPRPPRSEAKRTLGLDPARPLVLYTGSLGEAKGTPALLAAARDLPEAAFLLVGGREADAAAWRARATGLANVELRPFVPNAALPSYLAAADACALPTSARDPQAAFTSPLKLLEYMAAGAPIVASALPSVRALLEDRASALLVPPDDASALARALRELCADPDLAARLGSEAARAARRHTWERRAQEILAHFAPELLRKPARG
jgi:glycosyltransferase involved in cell wall biosynthesis